jgi:hypothetical protein
MTDNFDELFNKRLADRINESHEYSDKYYYAKLKCRVFDFLYHQYKTNIVNFTKLRMFKEYRISHPDDNIGFNKFKDYLKEGYYPYFIEKGYAIRLKSVINRILEEDIPQFAELTVTSITKLKKLLYIIAQSVPFKPNYSKIGRDLDLYRTTVSDLFQLLDKAELINLLEDETQGISSLAKVDKVYLNNPNISYALSENEPEIGNVRETIFFALTSVLYNVYSSKVSDFKINEYTFEVGGKNKKQKQIQGIKNAFVVKDDIESGYLNVIPLWEFGLLY